MSQSSAIERSAYDDWPMAGGGVDIFTSQADSSPMGSSTSYSGIYDPLSGSGGIGSEIVGVLRAYNKALPVAFLAKVLNRSVADLDADVRRLEFSAVVKREGDEVRLAG